MIFKYFDKKVLSFENFLVVSKIKPIKLCFEPKLLKLMKLNCQTNKKYTWHQCRIFFIF